MRIDLNGEAGDGRIRLEPDAGEDALAQAHGAPAVDIAFPAFTDGRGFSLAARLRAEGYAGELRAVGALIPDQAGHLARASFDACAPETRADDSAWRTALERYAFAYQPGADARAPAMLRRARSAREAAARRLNAELGEAAPEAVIDAALAYAPGRTGVLSSFGAEAAATLALTARVDPDVPVLFLETGRHFAQTLSYARTLEAELGLTRVIRLTPDAAEAHAEDADDRLWSRDPDACCALRKVRPLARALPGYDALITGRKRSHGGDRADLPVVEFDGDQLRFNPLARWSQADVAAFLDAEGLPRHPLVAQGFPSIGCWPCTAPVNDREDPRAGRWAGLDKTECGIHDRERLERAEGSRRLL